MKQKDIALIIVIAIISGIASFLISNKLFVTPKNRQQEVSVVDVISPDFSPPNTKYFNSSSIDTYTPIQIGVDTNASPFNGSTDQGQ